MTVLLCVLAFNDENTTISFPNQYVLTCFHKLIDVLIPKKITNNPYFPRFQIILFLYEEMWKIQGIIKVIIARYPITGAETP